MANEAETAAVAVRLKHAFPRVMFSVEEDSEHGYYVRVIADPGDPPNLETALPAGWRVTPWLNSDQRHNFTSIVDYI